MKNTFTGGFRVGKGGLSCINGTYPLGKLRVEDKIYLECGFWIFKKTYVFELDEVLIKVGVLLFADSIQIIHNNPSYNSHIYFHTFNPENIARLLKSKGILIEEYSKTPLQKVLKFAFYTFVSIFLIFWTTGFLLGLILLACKALGYI